MSDANKHTALITGGAKRLGAHAARHLAAAGYDIVLHYHQSAVEAKALAAALPTKVTLVQADLSQPASLAGFWETLPPCDTLILSAATYERDTLADMKAETLHHQIAVNIEAPLLLAQGFMKQLPTDASGNIITIGDGALGWSVAPPFFSYAVSKHAWVSLIELLAAAVAPQARANLIALAPTLPNDGEDDALFTRLAERAPLKRTGTPHELFTAIDFLLASPGVTGQVISLANGMGLQVARP